MRHFLSTNAFLLVCLYTVPRLQAQQCSGASFSREFNKRLTCGLFKTISAQQIDCHTTCKNTVNCFSANLYKSDNGTDICELSRGTKKLYGEESPCFDWKENCEYNEIMVRFWNSKNDRIFWQIPINYFFDSYTEMYFLLYYISQQ